MEYTHLWPFSKSKFNLKSDRVNLVAPASPIECLLHLPNVRAIQYNLGPERLTRLGNSNVLRLPVTTWSGKTCIWYRCKSDIAFFMSRDTFNYAHTVPLNSMIDYDALLYTLIPIKLYSRKTTFNIIYIIK